MANPNPEEIKTPESAVEQIKPKEGEERERIGNLIETNKKKLAEARAKFEKAAAALKMLEEMPEISAGLKAEYDQLDEELDSLEKKEMELEKMASAPEQTAEPKAEELKPEKEPVKNEAEPKLRIVKDANRVEMAATEPAAAESVVVKEKEQPSLQDDLKLEEEVIADREKKLAELKARAIKEGVFEGYISQKKALESEIADAKHSAAELRSKIEVSEGYEPVEDSQIVSEVVPPPLPKEESETEPQKAVENRTEETEVRVGEEDINLPEEEPEKVVELKPVESVAAKPIAEIAKEAVKEHKAEPAKTETVVRETAAPEAGAEMSAPAVAAETVVSSNAEQAPGTGKEDLLGAIAAEGGMSKDELAIKGLNKILDNPELMKDEGAVAKAIDSFSGVVSKVDAHMGPVREFWDKKVPDPLKKLMRFAEKATGPLAELMPLHAAEKLGIVERPGGTITETGEDQFLEEDRKKMEKLGLIVKNVPGLQELKPFVEPVKKLSATNEAAFARVRENLKKAREERTVEEAANAGTSEAPAETGEKAPAKKESPRPPDTEKPMDKETALQELYLKRDVMDMKMRELISAKDKSTGDARKKYEADLAAIGKEYLALMDKEAELKKSTDQKTTAETAPAEQPDSQSAETPPSEQTQLEFAEKFNGIQSAFDQLQEKFHSTDPRGGVVTVENPAIFDELLAEIPAMNAQIEALESSVDASKYATQIEEMKQQTAALQSSVLRRKAAIEAYQSM